MTQKTKDLETLFRNGDYKALELLQASIKPDNWQSVDEVVFGARNRIEQGAYSHALDLFKQAEILERDPKKRLRLRLQTLSVEGVVDGEMQSCFEKAKNLVASHEDEIKDPLIRAFLLRLELASAIGLQIKPKHIAPKFAAICQELGYSDPLHAALVGRWWITSLSRFESRMTVTDQVVNWARDAGFPHIGAEALISAAQSALDEYSSRSQIEDIFDKSEKLFEEANHKCGHLFVKLERCKYHLQTGEGDLPALEALIPQFAEYCAWQRLQTTANLLASRFDESGHKHKVSQYRELGKSVIQHLGVKIDFGITVLDKIERLRRTAEPVASINNANDALSREKNEVTKATILQSRARAFADLDDYDQAIKDIEAARTVLVKFSASAHVSNLESERALYYVRQNTKGSYGRADAVIKEAAAADFADGRPGNGMQKLRMRATLAFQEYEKLRDVSILDRANVLVSEAMKSNNEFPRAIADIHNANCLQILGQIEASRGNTDGAREATNEASRLATYYNRGPLAAGCDFMLGIMDLNSAVESGKDSNLHETLELYGSAYENFGKAAERFELVGSEQMLASALMYQAETTANVAISVGQLTDAKLTDEAIRLATLADEVFERRRTELKLGDALADWQARQELSRDWERLSDLFLRIHTIHRPDMPALWERLQKSKARSMMDALNEPSDSGSLVEPVSYKSAVEWLSAQPRSIALVDWAILGGRVYIMVLRQGQEAILRLLSIDAQRLENEIRAFCGIQLSATLALFPEILSSFNDLVAPLTDLTQPGEMLVLCPWRTMSLLPLHALKIDDNYLIDRNPLLYVPNHAFAMYNQEHGKADNSIAIFGNPTADLPTAESLAVEIGNELNATPHLGDSVTAEKIETALQQATVIHYQGHGVHDLNVPLNSALNLNAGPYRASEIVNGEPSVAELLVLAACESGVAKMARGGEPNGLTQAFLLRGVKRVISTLWNTHDEAAEIFMRNFYARLYSGALVDVFQQAMIETRNELGNDKIHYWAPFLLTGAWTAI